MLINKQKVKEKTWITKSVDSPEFRASVTEIASTLGVNHIIASLLYNRGYTDARSAASFLRMENEMLRNPFDLADMLKAVECIIRAIERGEKITVYGDYDVDGVTSVCTLYLYLNSLGAKVSYYIPNRSGEGYGVSCSAIDAIKESGSSLIITVDTGVTAIDEVDYARSIGVEFIVTDHHECRSELPNACAVVNPHRPDCKYPFKELAGVGVVFKLICAIEEKYNGKDRLNATLFVLKEYADLVAIGTIADVMPIKEENRIIVKYGLSLINKSTRVGIEALIDAAGARPDNRRSDKFFKKKRKNIITSSYIGFTLAPRINAAGRVRSATLAAELFLAEDYRSAYDIALKLCEANKERQNEENSIMNEAYKKIEGLDIINNPVIVLDADNWHHGVIGIVASRITDKYSRPAILISFEGNESDLPLCSDIGKGSGRSIKGLNLVDALCYCSEYLVKFGGHELAAGLSVTRENLPLFIEKINEFARTNLHDEELTPTIETDLEISLSDINLALAEQLQLLEPYGVGNPVPMFVMRDVSVSEISGVSENKHTKLVLGDGRSLIHAMYFSNSPESLGIYTGDKVDVLFSIDINEWQDRKNVQLIVRDIKVSSSKKSRYNLEKARFKEIYSGAAYTEEECVLPDRSDFVAVYTLIQNAARQGQNSFSHNRLISMLEKSNPKQKIGYIKLKFIIMIYKEMNLLTIEEPTEEVYTFTLHYSSTKQNLEKSNILKKLRTQIR